MLRFTARSASIAQRMVARPVAARLAQTAFRAPAIRQFAAAAASSSAEAKPAMHCFQCEQTKNGTGCTDIGVCGKTPAVAGLQDLLMFTIKGLSQAAVAARDLGVPESAEVNRFTLLSLFSTLTNVNFDDAKIAEYIREAAKLRDERRAAAEAAAKAQGKAVPKFAKAIDGDTFFVPANDLQGLLKQADAVGNLERKAKLGADLHGMQELITYGIKGTSAYAQHAQVAGREDNKVYDDIQRIMAFLADPASGSQDLMTLVGTAMKVGEVNLTVTEMLDAAHNARFGTPTPTKVLTSAKAGKCILVSGHDLNDLEALLKATEGKGVNIYTHGEMLPAHGYPELKKYKHLVGNYGSAWQNQKFEFAKFPGSILMTSNCLIEPRQSYKSRIFTMGPVGWPGVRHLEHGDLKPLIEAALAAPGYAADEPEKSTTTGFAHGAVLGVAGKVVEAVNTGDLKRIVLIGGCDGSEGERNYYKQLALQLPKEAMVLTLGCAKYRFNQHDFGTLEKTGLPRYLDMGQCNDSYSAIKVASALASHYKTDVNGLPLSLALSWFEQKAVAVLLTLLHLGVKNIRIGPNLPAFVTPNVLDFLVKNFQLKQVNYKDVNADIKNLMAGN